MFPYDRIRREFDTDVLRECSALGAHAKIDLASSHGIQQKEPT
jgi:hypothetical protein